MAFPSALLILALGVGPTAVPFSAGDLDSLPELTRWLALWAPADSVLGVPSFRLESSWELKGRVWTLPDGWTSVAAVPRWKAALLVFSPDSSYAVDLWSSVDSTGAVMLEPDTDAWLLDLVSGRRTRVLFCGTPCDFEMATWLDASTVLIGGANWDELAPDLYRIDVSRGIVEAFRGPDLPRDRAGVVRAAIRRWWKVRFSTLRWDPEDEQ